MTLAPQPAAVRRARVVALYLPQFHPIPENDAVVGSRASPSGPTSPRPARCSAVTSSRGCPAELGLLRPARCRRCARRRRSSPRRPASRRSATGTTGSAAGARCSSGRSREVLESGAPDFPFCLAWANQTWTGVWHGAPDRVLMEQRYPGTRGRRGALQPPPAGIPRSPVLCASKAGRCSTCSHRSSFRPRSSGLPAGASWHERPDSASSCVTAEHSGPATP